MAKKLATADASLVLAYGKEHVLVGRAIDAVMRAARQADPSVTRLDISAAAESAGADLSEALSPSLFADLTVVVLTGIDEATDSVVAVVTDAMNNLPPYVRLVVTHPGGTKGKRLLDAIRAAGALEAACGELKGKDLESALAAEFARHKRKASADAVTTLIASVGTDLGELLAAVSQLCADTTEDVVTGAAVSAYYDGIADVKGWDLADAMWMGNPAQMLEQFRWALRNDGAAAPSMLWALSNGLRTLVRYASAPGGLRENDLAAHVGVPTWRLTKLAAQKARWTPDQLAVAARLLAQADRSAKGTRYDPAVTAGISLDGTQSSYEIEMNLLAVRPPKD